MNVIDKVSTLYRQVVRRLEGVDLSTTSVRKVFHEASDEEWFWALTKGRKKLPEVNRLLPRLPDEDIQARFTGVSGDKTIRIAGEIYKVFRQAAVDMGMDYSNSTNKIVDFGCGWGRLLQLFLKDFEKENIIGVDVLQEALDICRQCGVNNPLVKVDPWPPSGIQDESVNLIVAYSVFSHLSEENHWAWMNEFHRILVPGGLAIVTTRPRSFITYVQSLREMKNLPPHAYGAAMAFKDTDAVLKQYDAGEYCFSVEGAGGEGLKGFYGEACIPKIYIENKWRTLFSEVDYIDQSKHNAFDQNVLIAKKE